MENPKTKYNSVVEHIDFESLIMPESVAKKSHFLDFDDCCSYSIDPRLVFKEAKRKSTENDLKEEEERKEFKYKCSICLARFKFRMQLKRHTLLHNNQSLNNKIIKVDKASLECDVCKRRFQRNYELNRHKERVHEEVLSLCKKGCGRRFSNKQILSYLLHEQNCKGKKTQNIKK